MAYLDIFLKFLELLLKINRPQQIIFNVIVALQLIRVNAHC